MNKKILIIIGITTILLLSFIWAYLILFGTPKDTQDVFSNLNFESEENPPNIEEPDVESKPVVNIERPALRQLTTRSVAGFREIDTSPTPVIYYSEKGTGHIYSINLTSGEETRISGTTVPGVYTAQISPKGDYVAMGIKSNTKNTPIVIGIISSSTEDNMSIEDFDTSIDQFSIQDGEELLYTTREEYGLGGYSYNFSKESKEKIFDIPFHEAVVQWGKQKEETHYFYPKSSYSLEGYLYQAKNKKISRVPVEGYGFSGLANADTIAYTKFIDLKTQNFLYNRDTGENINLRVSFLPEKCIISSVSNLICAYQDIKMPIGYPDTWYQGTLSFSDSLWLISGKDLSVKKLIDTQAESGREIDVTNLGIGTSETGVYFINKNDNTLWMYEL
jgi:hypothetical protein